MAFGIRAAAVLGFLLPIYAVADLSPGLFFGAKAVLMGLLAMALATIPGRSSRFLDRAWAPYLLGIIVGSIASGSGASVAVAMTTIGAVIVGSLVGRNPRFLHELLVGFRAGVFVSSLVLILDVLGYTKLSPPNLQLLGHGGLWSRSTGFSYLAALALAFWRFMPGGRASRWARARWLFEGGVVFAALLASGGRGGLVAALLVLLTAVFTLAKRYNPAITIAIVGLSVGLAVFSGAELFSIQRLLDWETKSSIDEFSSGRLELYRLALSEALEGPLLGRGLEAGVTPEGATTAISAHNSILEALLAGGIVAGIGATLLLFRSLHLAATAILRSDLFFVGGGLVVLIVKATLDSGTLIGASNPFLFAALLAAGLSARYQAVVQSRLHGSRRGSPDRLPDGSTLNTMGTPRKVW